MQQILLPKICSGTSLLGNLYRELPYTDKLSIVKAYIDACPGTPTFDSAGKYGAGLALQELGKCLKDLGIKPGEVWISNKLAWVRKPLTTSNPTFEKGVWHNLKFDAEQKISYQGILECYRQGIELLDGYTPQFVSVHDPDDYLHAATSEDDYKQRYEDILEAYRALNDLKKQGMVMAVGVGAKDWHSIKKISEDISLDWAMIANSYTIFNHPKDLIDFVESLRKKDITIINSAVFHGGFLMGSDYFNYMPLSRENPAHAKYYQWRDKFNALCAEHGIEPAAAAIYFAMHVPGVRSIALNSSNPERVRKNLAMADLQIDTSFWQILKTAGLIAADYPHL
ncbi:MAG: aldo/keto reductase [Niabella sp.]